MIPIHQITPPVTEELRDSIRENGWTADFPVRETVVLPADGTLIDGRHRLSVCCELGIRAKKKRGSGPREGAA
jgi:hypothetical protein